MYLGQSGLINTILLVDFALLSIVFFLYIRRSRRARMELSREANQALNLQQKVYQIEVLQEIGERIGYSLDTNKIVEIITSSIGNLLEYDTVAYMILEDPDSIVFKCHIEHTVSHIFVEQTKEKMLNSLSAILDREVSLWKIDESVTGKILDDSHETQVNSYFNLPIVISGKLLGLITVASRDFGLYGSTSASVLYSITNQACTAVSKLYTMLESERGKLTSIIYSMTDGVIMVGMDYRIKVSNPAVKEILQIFANTEVSMFDIVDVLAGKIDLRTKIEQAIIKHQPIIISDVYIKERAIELVITPVRSQTGEQLGAAVVFHDVTSEKSLEKLRQEFTAMMVHELRAPLTAVRWSSEAMLKSVGSSTTAMSSEKVKESMNNIHTATSDMLDLVNDLLDVAKIEAGKFELNIQNYDIVSIIKEEAQVFKSLAESKRLGFNLILPEKQMIKCDRVRVCQVLSNLLSNAIKYTDSGQIDINLSVNVKEQQAVISIKDTGLGVSREDIAQLFNKFKQLKSQDNSRKGTGLGLVVSKGIVDSHGGRIWAESTGESLGSTFYFSLPM